MPLDFSVLSKINGQWRGLEIWAHSHFFEALNFRTILGKGLESATRISFCLHEKQDGNLSLLYKLTSHVLFLLLRTSRAQSGLINVSNSKETLVRRLQFPNVK